MTTTPESWEQQLHNALQSLAYEEQQREDAEARADDLARQLDEARLKLTRFESMFGDVDTAQARLDGQEAIAAELRDRAERAEAEVRHHIDAGQRDDEKITALTAERAALWHLLRKQTRQMRIWRRRANTAITEAVEQTARDMQRAGQLRRERDEARHLAKTALLRIGEALRLCDPHPLRHPDTQRAIRAALSEPAADACPVCGRSTGHKLSCRFQNRRDATDTTPDTSTAPTIREQAVAREHVAASVADLLMDVAPDMQTRQRVADRVVNHLAEFGHLVTARPGWVPESDPWPPAPDTRPGWTFTVEEIDLTTTPEES